MTVEVKPERLRETKWTEYALRFAFGGIVTAGTGLIARRFGPAVGGLFLAFPAILPASVTLIEKHHGKEEAGDDAAGAAYGAVGLAAFGAVVWLLASRGSAFVVLPTAFALWLVVSAGLWAAANAIKR